MDLGDLRELSEDPSGLRRFRRPILAWWNLLEEMPKPTICQIHGAALGGAFELALACDFRTMAEDAMAGIMEVRVGLLPDVGGCSRLPAVVGLGNAKELIMTGKVIDGARGAPDRLRQPDRPGRRAGRGHRGVRRTSCWPARPGPSGWPSASSTPRPSRLWRSTLEQEVAAQERLRRARTSPRARAPSSRSATRSSPGAEWLRADTGFTAPTGTWYNPDASPAEAGFVGTPSGFPRPSLGRKRRASDHGIRARCR